MSDHLITRYRYSNVAIALHWLIVTLLIAQFAIAWTMPGIHKGTVPEALINWHLSTGVFILIAMLARVVWRVTHRPPSAPDALPPTLQFVSRITHLTLYTLLVALPLLGWANASARGWTVTLFGTLRMPQLVATDSAFGRLAGNLHATLAIVLLVVIALHICGALYHRVVLRDRTLARMMPTGFQ